jgi:8-oxo-dGTP diphosphatase
MTRLVKVSAAICVKDHQVFIAQRRPADFLGGYWEFPGGKIKADETPEQCLIRELKEELNIDICVGKRIGSHIHHYDHISIELIAFSAEVIKGEIVLREHADCKWVNINDLSRFKFSAADIPFVKMIKRGDVLL